MKKILILFIVSSIILNAQTKEELQKLNDFAKLYGVVRYFHPSDESANLDWKKFTLYGVNEVLESSSDSDEKLKQLFLPIAPSISFENQQYQWETDSLIPVFWEHKGLGLGLNTKSNIYKSTRINRKDNGNAFLAYGTTVPTNERTDDIRLIYECKTDLKGKGYVWIKPYNKSREKVTFKNNENAPTNNENWEKDTLILNTQNKPYNKINFGLISKDGKVSFRNVKLGIKQKEEIWKEINIPDLDNQKWYKINYPNMIITSNEITFLDKEIFPINEEVKPNNSVSLSNDLKVNVPAIVYGNQDYTLPVYSDINNFYEKIDSTKTNRYNRNISIANVIIAWNVFKYFYPYQKEVKVNWETTLEEALIDAFDDSTRYESVLTLRRFTENFKDGHIHVYGKALGKQQSYSPPFTWSWLENKLVISKIKDSSIPELKIGDIVTKINRQSAKDYIDSTAQFISGSPQRKKDRALMNGLRGKEESVLELEFEDGKKLSIKRRLSYSKNREFYAREYDYPEIENLDDMLYLNLDKLKLETLRRNLDKLKSSKKIIFDLRGYPQKGVSMFLNANFFYNKVDNNSFQMPIIYSPNFDNVSWKNSHWNYKKKDSLNAKIVLLVDEHAMSQSESVTDYLKKNDYVTVIGQPTAGANGNINYVQLLNDIAFIFTGMKVTNYDDSQLHSIGILPDIYVEETINDLKKNKDAFMEKAIEYLNQQ